MAPLTPTGVPAQVIAGDTWKWRIQDLQDYPFSESWQLLYEFVGIAALHITQAMVVYASTGADAGFWVITVPLGSTTIAAGRYRLLGRMVGSGTYAGLEYTISDDVVVLIANPRTAAAGDFQTQAEKMLAKIDAEISARLSGTAGSAHESYQVDGRALNKVTLHDLNRLRGKYAGRVYREKTGRVGERVAADFTRRSRTSPNTVGKDWIGDSVD